MSSTTVFENVESCKKEDEKHILFAWHARAARLLRSPSPTRQMSRLLATCAACAAAYFAWVLSVVAPHAPRLFAPRFGRGHRLAGAAHLVLLLVGVADLLARVSQASFGASARPPLDLVALPLGRAWVSGAFLYDALLGVSGCALTRSRPRRISAFPARACATARAARWTTTRRSPGRRSWSICFTRR